MQASPDTPAHETLGGTPMMETTSPVRRGGIRRRGLAAIPAAVVALVLFASPALAHFCSNTQRSATAQAAVAANSNGWFTLESFIPELGLCPAGETALRASLAAEGIDLDMPILANSVLASGTFKKGKDVKPIGYLPDVDFDALIGEAFAVCAP